MRVLIVDTFYPSFVTFHYGTHPGLSDASYDAQWTSLMSTFFGTADAYSHYLGELGHEAHELVVNVEPLQRAWAREHGVRPSLRSRIRRGARTELVIEQVEAFSPDAVYVQNLSVLAPETLRLIRKGGRLLAGQIASELPHRSQLEPFDVIFTSFPHFVDRLRAFGIRSEYLRIGFDPRVLDLVTPSQGHQTVFVGSLGRLQHDRGNSILAAAAERSEIDFWGRGYEDWPPDSRVRRNYHGEAWGIDMYRVLANSKISLNRHIDVAGEYANNMRLYESTGVGSLLLTDAKVNLGELFDVGREVATYEGVDDLVRSIEYYLVHEDERREIAAAGQRRTLAAHTYRQRMEDLVAMLGDYIA